MEAGRGKAGLSDGRMETYRPETGRQETGWLDIRRTEARRIEAGRTEVRPPEVRRYTIAVTLPNFERMLRLAGEFFAVKDDPSQLNVTPVVIERLKRLHPATLSDYSTPEGPVVWILIIPTTLDIMERFLRNEINETEILDLTPVPGIYEAMYLCSALVLPEYRGRGLAAKVADEAIAAVRRDHPVRVLFYWEFSVEGRRLAETVSRSSGLELRSRGIRNQPGGNPRP